MPTTDDLYLILTFVAWVPAAVYPLVYGLTTKWWKSWIGRALMVESIGTATLLMLSISFQLFGPAYWGRNVLRFGALTLAATGFWLVLFALLRVQAEARQQRRNRLDTPLAR